MDLEMKIKKLFCSEKIKMKWFRMRSSQLISITIRYLVIIILIWIPLIHLKYSLALFSYLNSMGINPSILVRMEIKLIKIKRIFSIILPRILLNEINYLIIFIIFYINKNFK